MEDRVLLGRLGEELAAGLLYADGYEILERGFRCRSGEIDLIARKDDALIFVEVKARTGSGYGLPKEAVDKKKREKIRKCAEYYQMINGFEGLKCSFQVIGILIEQIPDAF